MILNIMAAFMAIKESQSHPERKEIFCKLLRTKCCMLMLIFLSELERDSIIFTNNLTMLHGWFMTFLVKNIKNQ